MKQLSAMGRSGMKSLKNMVTDNCDVKHGIYYVKFQTCGYGNIQSTAETHMAPLQHMKKGFLFM